LPNSIGHYIDGNVVECLAANAIAVISAATEEQVGLPEERMRPKMQRHLLRGIRYQTEHYASTGWPR